MIEINKIYNENCLDTMKRIPDGFVNLVVTSPPYNMNLRIRNGEYCSRQITKEFSTKYEGFDDNMPIDDFYKLHKEILGELIRVSKIVFYNIQIVTGSKRAFFKMIGDYSDNLKDIIVWDKGFAQPSMHESVLNKRTELILVFEKPELAISRGFDFCNFKRGELEDIWLIRRGKKNCDSHSATFPDELAEKIISTFSKEGDIIYDPFLGSGTTAIASLVTNRNFIGSELLKTYCDISEDRIKETKNKMQFMGRI